MSGRERRDRLGAVGRARGRRIRRRLDWISVRAEASHDAAAVGRDHVGVLALHRRFELLAFVVQHFPSLLFRFFPFR